MKYFQALAVAATAASALTIGNKQQPILNDQDVLLQDRYLIETSPGVTRWISEDEKWKLKREGLKFMDITDNKHTYPHVSIREQAQIKFPSKTVYNETVVPLSEHLSKDSMHARLTKFSSFYTRYFKSEYGIKSAEWLYGQITDVVKAAGADKHGATVNKFAHSWGQFSIIAQFPGKTNKTVVVGAHQDSVNMFLPMYFPAPGADDDGSGTVTILEALEALLQSENIVKGEAENTIEFHWYSAEEGGLLGSQAIFKSYAEERRDVRAMLQQDMTGYVQGTLDAGKPEAVGVITDFVDAGLSEFIKQVITTYCDIPYVETKCGYACSDHASASKYGYPSAFVIESEFGDSNLHKIHTSDDLVDYLSFDHMLQHAKMTLGLAYELSMADL